MVGRRKKLKLQNLYKKHATPDGQSVQRKAAFAAIKRLYWEVLPLWRACRRGACRRHQRCCGQALACLKRGWPQMPPELQKSAHSQVLAGGPRRVPPATRMELELRRFPETNFVL